MEEKQFIQFIIKDKSKNGTSKSEFQNFDEDETSPNISNSGKIDIG
jgi:hypothetical protein